MLGSHAGWVVSQGEILAELFAERGHRVLLTSRARQPLLRVADILQTLVRHRCVIDLALVMVFSGRGFALADASSWLARRLGQPLIFCLRGGNLPAFSQTHARWVARVMRRADLLVAPSRYLATKLPAWGPPVTVIPNVVRIARCPFRPRTQLAPRLLWMRTFHDIYCPELAIDVLAHLRQQHGDATLTMAGQDRGRLGATRAHAKALGLERAVRFAGFLDSEAKQNEFSMHDVFINTNKIDNTPVSVIEAAAFGLPVVATAVGGIPYLLRDGQDALLVPAHEAVAMAAAVARLIAEPALAARLSEAGRALARRCAWPAVAGLWDAAFARVAAMRA